MTCFPVKLFDLRDFSRSSESHFYEQFCILLILCGTNVIILSCNFSFNEETCGCMKESILLKEELEYKRINDIQQCVNILCLIQLN